MLDAVTIFQHQDSRARVALFPRSVLYYDPAVRVRTQAAEIGVRFSPKDAVA